MEKEEEKSQNPFPTDFRIKGNQVENTNLENHNFEYADNWDE